MKFMVVENFKPGAKAAVYKRFHAKGRLLPDGLEFVESWRERDGDRVFQLMQTTQKELFDEWMLAWQDLVEFEVIPLED